MTNGVIKVSLGGTSKLIPISTQRKDIETTVQELYDEIRALLQTDKELKVKRRRG